jgi:hypothetical protein
MSFLQRPGKLEQCSDAKHVLKTWVRLQPNVPTAHRGKCEFLQALERQQNWAKQPKLQEKKFKLREAEKPPIQAAVTGCGPLEIYELRPTLPITAQRICISRCSSNLNYSEAFME